MARPTSHRTNHMLWMCWAVVLPFPVVVLWPVTIDHAPETLAAAQRAHWIAGAAAVTALVLAGGGSTARKLLDVVRDYLRRK